jgi:uncharacterized membrane protein YfhO
VDGIETPIACEDILFRKVALPTGARSVEFSYEPASVRYGVILSGIGLLLVLLVAAVSCYSAFNRAYGGKQ